MPISAIGVRTSIGAVRLAPSRGRTIRPESLGFFYLVCLIGLIAAAKGILVDNLDPDCFWHLRVAEQLHADGIGPLIDHLSFASLQTPWTPYSWLAELGMKSLWDAGGYRLAVLVGAAMQVGFVLAVAAACRTVRAAEGPRARFLPPAGTICGEDRRPPRFCAAMATAFAAFISVPYLSFRPVTAALLMLGACCWLLARDRRKGERSRAVWAVVPIAAVTINLHLYAGFIPVWIAALLAGSLWERWFEADAAERREADRRAGRYFLLLAATSGACLMTPMLPGDVAVALHYHFHDPMVASGFIREMLPFFWGSAGHVSAALVIGCIGLIAARQARLRPGEKIWLAISLIVLSRLGRFAPVFAIVAAPQLAVTLPHWSDRPLGRAPMRWAMLAVLALGMVRLAIAFPRASASADAWLSRPGLGRAAFPAAAARFVRQHVARGSGRLVTEFSWGGYMEWTLGDRYQVLLDGRTQLFAPELWYATYLGGPDARRTFLAQADADVAVLPPRRSMFRHALVRLGWRSVWRDATSEVLIPPRSRPHAPESTGWSPTAGLFPE